MFFDGEQFIEINPCIEGWADDIWPEMNNTSRYERAYALPDNCGIGMLAEMNG